MKLAVQEIVRELEEVVGLLDEAVDQQRWEAVRELARRVLSAGSKLHARSNLLEELAQEAYFAAQVDRAVKTRVKKAKVEGG